MYVSLRFILYNNNNINIHSKYCNAFLFLLFIIIKCIIIVLIIINNNNN